MIMSLVKFLFLTVFVVLFLCAIPLFFIILIFAESVFCGLKKVQSIKSNSKFIKLQSDTEIAHQLMFKALSLTCSSKKIKLPFYLVTAYIFISQGEVYEINPKTKKLLRVFSYNTEFDKISISNKGGNRIKEMVHQIPDLEPSTYEYLTYLPDNIIR